MRGSRPASSAVFLLESDRGLEAVYHLSTCTVPSDCLQGEKEERREQEGGAGRRKITFF